MKFTIKQLEAFREVMRTGAISEAARALNRTQPAISATITALEEALDFKLFLRQKGRLVARPEAHYFDEEVSEILERLQYSARMMDRLKEAEHGKLRIGCLPAAADHLMPYELAVFLKERPQVEASLMMRTSEVIADLVASQQFDIGLAEMPAKRQTLKVTEIPTGCCIAMHKDDPLASRAVLTPSMLETRDAAMLFDEHPSAVSLRMAFAQEGCKLRQRFELQTYQPALELVGHGLCYCLCDLMTAESYQIGSHGAGSVRFVPFRPAINSSIAILEPAQRPQSLIAQAFVSQLSARLKGLSLPATGHLGS